MDETHTLPSGHPEGIVPVIARIRPSGGFELWAWVFMRVSGALLIVLALGHVVVMHLVTGVENLSYEFVAGRFAGTFWRGYDGLMLILGVLHGMNGLRMIAEDYVRRPGRSRAVRIALAFVCAFLVALGLVVVVTFEQAG